jgi:branched-chain amino acid transport system substrate-binding protein
MRKSCGKRFSGGQFVAGLLVAAALVLSACGDDDDSSGADSSGNGGSSASAPTGKPIKVGLFATLTSPYAAAGSAGGTVGPAWEKWINEEQGGINGRPVELIVKDEAGDPAIAQKGAKELVEEGVVAVVAASDYLATGYSGTLIDAGIPVISGTANVPDWFKKPGMFPTVGTPNALAGQVIVAKEFGKATSFGSVVCAEVPSCAEAVSVLKAKAEELGLEFTSLSVKATQPNFTAECLTLKERGVDYANLNFPGAIAARFVQECAQQGYTPTYGLGIQTIGKELLEVSGMKSFGPTDAFLTVADAPPVEEYRAAMEAYAADDNWHYGTSAFAWTGLTLLRQVLDGISGEPTAEAVLDGLYKVKNDDLGGLASNPLTYTKGKPSDLADFPCFFVQGIENNELIAPQGLEPICPES